MKRLTALLAAFLLAVLVAPAFPTGAAQATSNPAAGEAPPVHLLDDNKDDVKASAGGQSQPVGASYLDLVAFDALESQNDFAFTLTLASLKPAAEASIATSSSYRIQFQLHDVVYQLEYYRQSLDGQTANYGARLAVRDSNSNGFNQLGFYPVTADEAAGTMTVTLSRQVLLDSRGSAPYPGMPITGFQAQSLTLLDQFASGIRLGGKAAGRTVTLGDRMPDTGNGTLDLPVVIGVRQDGHARLMSNDPTRASNGGVPETIVFTVTLQNDAADKDTFLIRAKDIPSAWSVTVPAGSLEVAGHGNRTFPVLLTTPTTHVHGSFAKFTLQAQSESDAGTTGRIELGIRYLAIPQPAGHHNKVWFHGATYTTDQAITTACTVAPCGISYAYMNAIEEDPAIADPSQEPTVRAFSAGTCVDASNCPTPQQRYEWDLPLQPGLELGLDVVPGIVIEKAFRWPVSTKVPMLGSQVSGYLVHYGAPHAVQTDGNNGFAYQGNRTVIARILPTDPKDVTDSGNTPYVYEASIVGLPAGDFMPYEKGAALELVVNLTYTIVDPQLVNVAPQWARGGELSLPLKEYRDPVGEAFSLPTLVLTATSSLDREVNPGKEILYNMTLANQASQAGTYRVELVGEHSDWARILGNPEMQLGSFASQPFHIAVSVPASAQPGSTFHVVVKAVDTKDPTQQALLQLHASVDSQPARDDSALVASLDAANQPKKSPGAPMLLVLASVAALAVMLRRRRDD